MSRTQRPCSITCKPLCSGAHSNVAVICCSLCFSLVCYLHLQYCSYKGSGGTVTEARQLFSSSPLLFLVLRLVVLVLLTLSSGPCLSRHSCKQRRRLASTSNDTSLHDCIVFIVLLLFLLFLLLRQQLSISERLLLLYSLLYYFYFKPA